MRGRLRGEMMNKTRLGQAAGINQSTVSRIENGQREPGAGTLGRLAAALQVSTDHLLGLSDDPTPAAQLARELARTRARMRELGKQLAQLYLTRRHPRTFGRPGLADDPVQLKQLDQKIEKIASELAVLHKDAESQFPEATEESRQVLAFARPGIQTVPLVQGAGIAAGAGAAANDEYLLSYVPFRDDWLRRHGLNAEHCRVIEVVGRSMEPTLENGAVILVDFNRTTRRRNNVFAIRTEDGPIVKRLRHDEAGWWLVSDNREYAPRPWPAGAAVLGQVMWTGRTL